MPTTISGLPVHVLLVHIVVIFVPLAGLLLVLSALWPTARRRIGVISPIVAGVAFAFVPVTTRAGEWLRAHIPANELIRRHAALGRGLLPWVAGTFVLAVVVWLLGRRADANSRAASTALVPAATPDTATAGGATPSVAKSAAQESAARNVPAWASIVIAVLAVVVALGATVQLLRIADSGTTAVWTGVVTSKG